MRIAAFSSHLFSPTHSWLATAENPHQTPREKIVEKLARRVDFYNVVQVIGTPASGKTTLVTKYYQRQGVPVTIIEAWPEKEYNPREFLVKNLHVDGYKDITVQNFKNSNVVLILDEAQMPYDNRELWLGFINTQMNRTYPLNHATKMSFTGCCKQSLISLRR